MKKGIVRILDKEMRYFSLLDDIDIENCVVAIKDCKVKTSSIDNEEKGQNDIVFDGYNFALSPQSYVALISKLLCPSGLLILQYDKELSIRDSQFKTLAKLRLLLFLYGLKGSFTLVGSRVSNGKLIIVTQSSVGDSFVSKIYSIIKILRIALFSARIVNFDVMKLYNSRKKTGGFSSPVYTSYLINESNTSGVLPLTHITYPLAANAGDTVLSKCVRDVFHTSINPKWLIRNVTDSVTEDYVREINSTAGVVIGGGGLFLPDSNKNSKSGWQWPCDEEALSKIKVPIIVFAVGYNYFHGQKPDDLFSKSLRSLISKASFVGLRNRGSINAIKSIVGESADKVLYQPCPTTILSKFIPEVMSPDLKRIAVNVAFDRAERRFGIHSEEILYKIARALKTISEMGYNIELVCHCLDDIRFGIYLERVGVNFKIVMLRFSLPSEVISYYSGVGLTIGMRGHSQMIPFGLNRAIITLGTHNKMRWFLEDIDALYWYVDISRRETIYEEIMERFENIYIKECANTQNALLEKQEELWGISQKNIDYIKTMVN